VLGNLAEADLDGIWNSPTAQDLRRSMLTWDYSSLCANCLFTNRPPPERYLPFVEEVLERAGLRRQCVDSVLSVQSPSHMLRSTEAPAIRIARHEHTVDSYLLALSLGGEREHVEVFAVEPSEAADRSIEYEIPDEVWEGLRTNLGYWWAVFGLGADEAGRTLRSSEIRCLVRHEDVPRIEGSNLRYPDQGHRAPVDLGGGMQSGWRGGAPQSRPPLGARLTDAWRSERASTRSANGSSPGKTSKRLPEAEYRRLIRGLRAAVARVLPADATVLVIGKGDDQLLSIDCRAAWHFPCGEDGGYAGYHPPDGRWAVEHLEALRACGADYLLVPATAAWWFESYPEFADHLIYHYPVVFEDDSCVVFGIGPYPAFYGRKRDAAVNEHFQKAAP
jgi:hypothetical protein